jgi:putative tryptophan/tyrosine transport system substrate-binding protein
VVQMSGYDPKRTSDLISSLGTGMRRREFLGVLGGVAAAWPLAARAQEREQVRRIGVLMPAAGDDPEFQARIAAFHQGLALLGWTIGRNVRIDTRWATTDAAEIRRHAAELVALAPDVILAHAATTVGPLLQATRTVPVVFPTVVDPVGAGFVDSLARPGGNATGFLAFEYSLSGKWLELLKQVAPSVTRVAVLRNAATPSGPGQFGVIQAVAPSLRVEVSPVNVRDAGEIERAVAAFARSPNGGLIVTASPLAQHHRDLIVALAARHKLPAIYPFRYFAADGGLVSYGPNEVDQYRQAAGYVDRILKGEKPADLPVQAPTKYELVINLQDRQGARPHRAAVRARRRDVRSIGPKRTSLAAPHMSAFGGKADMTFCGKSAFAVASRGKADIAFCTAHICF